MKETSMQQDVIIVGAGFSGMVAAMSSAHKGASVLLIDRGAVGTGSNSAISNAMFTSPTQHFSPESYVAEALATGKGLNRRDIVELVADQAPEAIESLGAYGVAFTRSDHSYTVKTDRNDMVRGMTLVQTMAAAVKETERIRTQTGFYVTDLLTAQNQISGVKGFDNKGNIVSFHAPAVIMAAGGAGAVYLRNDNQKSTMGQGYALCAKAGVDLWDMEFVQFFPLVIAEPGLPGVMLYPPYPKEVQLINGAGEDLVKTYNLGELSVAVRKNRDEVSEIVHREGKTHPVCMDFRSVTEAQWQAYPVSLLARIHFDFKQNPIRVSPGAHYFMGGVQVDRACQTSVKGLFACGEMVWGLHGANRRGGNALTECAVFGKLAGTNAATHAAQAGRDVSGPAEESNESAWTNAPPVLKDLRALKKRIQEIAWNHAGISRHEAGLWQGRNQLAEVESAIRETSPSGHFEAKLKQDITSGILVLKAILAASLKRKESRGAFVREEFPERDDGNWKKNTRLSYDPAMQTFSVEHSPVV